MSTQKPQSRQRTSTSVAVVLAVGVALFAAIGVYLACLYALAPWQGFRLTPSSSLEFFAAGGLAAAAAMACCWRMLSGSTADDELLLLGDALANVDDAPATPLDDTAR